MEIEILQVRSRIYESRIYIIDDIVNVINPFIGAKSPLRHRGDSEFHWHFDEP